VGARSYPLSGRVGKPKIFIDSNITWVLIVGADVLIGPSATGFLQNKGGPLQFPSVEGWQPQADGVVVVGAGFHPIPPRLLRSPSLRAGTRNDKNNPLSICLTYLAVIIYNFNRRKYYE